MNVEIRVYKRHDTDLVALCSSGYSISRMMKEAVTGYANGTPVHFYLDEVTYFDMNDKKSFRTRFTIPESDTKTCFMLRNIKHGHRNGFCKAVLRNSFIQQNVGCYFSDASLLQLQVQNFQELNLNQYKNLIPCSQMRITRQISFLGRDITPAQPAPTPPRLKQKSVRVSPAQQVVTGMPQPVSTPTAPNPFMTGSPQMASPNPFMQTNGQVPNVYAPYIPAQNNPQAPQPPVSQVIQNVPVSQSVSPQPDTVSQQLQPVQQPVQVQPVQQPVQQPQQPADQIMPQPTYETAATQGVEEVLESPNSDTNDAENQNNSDKAIAKNDSLPLETSDTAITLSAIDTDLLDAFDNM